MRISEGRGPGNVFWPTLTLVAVIGLGFAGYRQRLVAVEVASMQSAKRAMNEELVTDRGALAGFLDIVARRRLLHPHFVGRVIGDSIPTRAARLYYTVRPWCAACAGNIPALNDLAAEFTGSVIGLAEDGTEELKRYASDHGVKFPVVASASGPAHDLMPTRLSPVTLLIVRDSVVAYYWGKLTDADVKAIRRGLTRGRLMEATIDGHTPQ